MLSINIFIYTFLYQISNFLSRKKQEFKSIAKSYRTTNYDLSYNKNPSVFLQRDYRKKMEIESTSILSLIQYIGVSAMSKIL